MEKKPMTRRGHTALETELKHLKSTERPAIIKAIAEAREHGDLSENAEYHSAREKHSFIEGRVKEIEGTLSLAEVSADTAHVENSVHPIWSDQLKMTVPKRPEAPDAGVRESSWARGACPRRGCVLRQRGGSGQLLERRRGGGWGILDFAGRGGPARGPPADHGLTQEL